MSVIPIPSNPASATFFDLVCQERDRQNRTYGGRDKGLSPCDPKWSLIIQEQSGQVAGAHLYLLGELDPEKGLPHDWRTVEELQRELVETAASCLQLYEKMESLKGSPGTLL